MSSRPDSKPEPVRADPEPRTEELRVAIALNGGVSLAVWMGGCAVELDRGRRAGASHNPTVYDALCKCFGRRLVIDILSGTSAGGINGALLAAAMVKGRRLDPKFVRNCWIELGDLGTILHDSSVESPTALMDGKKFHEELLKIFKAVLGTDAGVPGFDESKVPASAPRRGLIPSLDVTMTDVTGVERRFRDAWGGELIAREHRPRFRFREAQHFTAEALAAAARTSASFPVAFDAWRVAGDSRILAGLPRPTYGIDGGLLDNAPIRAALDLIPTRPAAAVVRRYLCYVTGDPTLREDDASQSPPTLPQVGGYTFSLPRVAPLVDHLYAIRSAVERPQRVSQVQDRLLRLDQSHLEGVAKALFDDYVQRRSLESLEELLPDPSDANTMYDLLAETGGRLPWIPHEWRPGGEKRWEWGMRPAQRILHLLLDQLRPRIAEAGEQTRRGLLDTRLLIEDQLALLSDARAAVTKPEATNSPSHFDEETATKRVNDAAALATAGAERTLGAVRAGAEALRDCMSKHPKLFDDEDLRRGLFGGRGAFSAFRHSDPGDEREWFSAFLRRVLSIEVIRRSFDAEVDIDTAENLHFVQLTPEAPSPIFTSQPLQLSGPTSAAQKLTGVGLGHFAGFYRRSWRANDYMWGRLDGAARIVDLLLDAPSREFGTGSGEACAEQARKRSAELSEALIAGAGEDGGWLLEEVLAERAEALDESSELKDRLRLTIEAELLTGEREAANPMPITRALFQRAAQLEVLREELPVLWDESKRDRKLGSGARPLQLGGKGARADVAAQVKAIRALHKRGTSLPMELTGKGEAVSDLGLQTITHAVFVGLSAIRTAGMPMSKFLGLARPPLLAVAGTVANRWLSRATAVAGFWAASIFLTSRIVTETGEAEPSFAAAWSPQTLMALVALLGALGFIAVPILRIRNGVARLWNAICAFALILAAGGLGAGLALRHGFSVERLLFAPEADNPKEWVLWTVLVVLGIVSLSRLPLPKSLQRIGNKLNKLPGAGIGMCLLLLAAFALLSAYAGQSVIDALDGTTWRSIAAWTALVLAPIAAGLAVNIWRLRKVPKVPG